MSGRPPDAVSCPLCGREQPAVPRYPDYACRSCVTRARSAQGRPLAFYNLGLSGGFVARFADTDDLAAEETVTHLVYVDDVPCRADEAHFGGIVLQPLTALQQESR